jgi:diacylglycerol kinase (ATP)
MRRAVLLFNPHSGMRRKQRLEHIRRAADVLKSKGVEVEIESTTSAGSAKQQAQRFISLGFDTIIACGGDGTIFDTLQGVATTDVALGVIPLGTGNSLANDLKLSRNTARAAQQLLDAKVRRIAIGKIEYQVAPGERDVRYFTVAAGIGVDAALFYKLNFSFKQRWGMAAYVAEALRQWAVQKYHQFQAEWLDADRNEKRSEVATQLLVVRIADFGGVLHRLAPGANIFRDDFRLVLFQTSSRLRFLRFVTGRLLRRDWRDPKIQLVHATQVCCLPYRADNQNVAGSVYAEADGENLGRIPVSISIVPQALNLLIPATASSSLNSSPS